VNQWETDSSFRSKYTRHLGGSNVGFADGHAAWFMADALVNDTPYCICCDPKTGTKNWYNTQGPIRGLCPANIDQTF
jgi:prepilin-type processing-associated H-X9-DG protein